MKLSRKSACASSCSTDRSLCLAARAATTGGVIECSPPRITGNLSRATISPTTRRISATTSSIDAKGNSISGSVKIPTPWTSVPVSSSHNSMCDDATRISCGPLRVPATYDVVRSSGIGRMTTRACAKSVVVGVVPPNSPMATWSYSNGRLIQLLEPLARHGLAVDCHDAAGKIEFRLFPGRKQPRARRRERRGKDGQGDGRVGLNRHFVGFHRQLAPALCLLEARPRGAAEVGHVG